MTWSRRGTAFCASCPYPSSTSAAPRRGRCLRCGSSTATTACCRTTGWPSTPPISWAGRPSRVPQLLPSHRRPGPGGLMESYRAQLGLDPIHYVTLPKRPAFDLVLRRIRSLKRCVQACGCKIMTPRYACNLAPGCISSEPTFAGLRKNKKKENKGPKKRGPRKKRKRGFLWQSLASLEMQPGAKLRRISRGHYAAF